MATPPPTIVPRVLTYRPWPAHQKRIGTGRMVSHTWHSIEPILDRNDSPLHCLHCALVYRYYFRMEETWNHVFVHRQLDKYQVWAICFMCWMPDSNAGPKVSRQLSQPLLSWKLWKCTLCRHRVHFQSFHHNTDITPRLENCNNLLCGLPIERTQNLQRCQEHSYTAGLQELEFFLSYNSRAARSPRATYRFTPQSTFCM